MSSQQQRRTAPWSKQERHYCAICNAWMGSDRQSRLLHENGAKHLQNLEQSRIDQRRQKQKEAQQQSQLQKALQQMEQTAMQSHLAQDGAQYASRMMMMTTSSSSSGNSHPPPPPPPPPPSAVIPNRVPSQPGRPIHIPSSSSSSNNKNNKQQEKQAWQTKKEDLRQQRKRHHRDKNDEDDDQPASKQTKRYIALNEGVHTSLGTTLLLPTCSSTTTTTTTINPPQPQEEDNEEKNTTKQPPLYYYLEGSTYGELLEPDLPVEFWTGPILASWNEKRLPEQTLFWKPALVVQVQRTNASQEVTTATLSYLATSHATEETIQRKVSLDRIRMQLGMDHEAMPKTLEEARLLAMGGEQLEVNVKHNHPKDEATGLSGWSTVAIQRTTVQQEQKQARARLRQERRNARQEALEQQQQVLQARSMEEAKVANADDSALGAYDVWNQGKGGYKGVQLEEELSSSNPTTTTTTTSTTVLDVMAKSSLAQGKVVTFKKKKKKKRGGNARRTTSADDDN